PTFMFQILMHWLQNSRRVMSSFFYHSKTATAMMVCGDLRSRTLTDICCSSDVHETHNSNSFIFDNFYLLVIWFYIASKKSFSEFCTLLLMLLEVLSYQYY